MPGWLALPDMGGQPSQHLFGFLLAPDFHGPAVLLAFPFGLAELVAEGGELVPVHHIDLIVFGDIGPEVAVGALHIEGPDFVVGLQTFAQVPAHKSEPGSLDRYEHFAQLDIRAAVICSAVVGSAVDSHIVAKVVFPSNAHILSGGNVVNLEGLHLKQPLSLISGIIIAPIDRDCKQNPQIFIVQNRQMFERICGGRCTNCTTTVT